MKSKDIHKGKQYFIVSNVGPSKLVKVLSFIKPDETNAGFQGYMVERIATGEVMRLEGPNRFIREAK